MPATAILSNYESLDFCGTSPYVAGIGCAGDRGIGMCLALRAFPVAAGIALSPFCHVGAGSVEFGE